jgi:hypothetical protein
MTGDPECYDLHLLFVSLLVSLSVPFGRDQRYFFFLCLLTPVKGIYTLFTVVTRRYTYILHDVVLFLSLSLFSMCYKVFCVHALIISLCSVLSILDFKILYIAG